MLCTNFLLNIRLVYIHFQIESKILNKNITMVVLINEISKCFIYLTHTIYLQKVSTSFYNLEKNF